MSNNKIDNENPKIKQNNYIQNTDQSPMTNKVYQSNQSSDRLNFKPSSNESGSSSSLLHSLNQLFRNYSDQLQVNRYNSKISKSTLSQIQRDVNDNSKLIRRLVKNVNKYYQDMDSKMNVVRMLIEINNKTNIDNSKVYNHFQIGDNNNLIENNLAERKTRNVAVNFNQDIDIQISGDSNSSQFNDYNLNMTDKSNENQNESNQIFKLKKEEDSIDAKKPYRQLDFTKKIQSHSDPNKLKMNQINSYNQKTTKSTKIKHEQQDTSINYYSNKCLNQNIEQDINYHSNNNIEISDNELNLKFSNYTDKQEYQSQITSEVKNNNRIKKIYNIFEPNKEIINFNIENQSIKNNQHFEEQNEIHEVKHNNTTTNNSTPLSRINVNKITEFLNSDSFKTNQFTSYHSQSQFRQNNQIQFGFGLQENQSVKNFYKLDLDECKFLPLDVIGYTPKDRQCQASFYAKEEEVCQYLGGKSTATQKPTLELQQQVTFSMSHELLSTLSPQESLDSDTLKNIDQKQAPDLLTQNVKSNKISLLNQNLFLYCLRNSRILKQGRYLQIFGGYNSYHKEQLNHILCYDIMSNKIQYKRTELQGRESHIMVEGKAGEIIIGFGYNKKSFNDIIIQNPEKDSKFEILTNDNRFIKFDYGLGYLADKDGVWILGGKHGLRLRIDSQKDQEYSIEQNDSLESRLGGYASLNESGILVLWNNQCNQVRSEADSNSLTIK